MTVADLRTPNFTTMYGPAIEAGGIDSLAVSATGAAAYGATVPGNSLIAVQRDGVVTRLDEGPDVDAKSVAAEDETLHWRRGDSDRSAPFP